VLRGRKIKMKKIFKVLTLGAAMGGAGLGLMHGQTIEVPNSEENKVAIAMREQNERERSIRRLEEAVHIKEMLDRLGITGNIGIYYDANNVPHLYVQESDGKPIEIIVPDNIQIVIRKESERGR
jgi:hypothetical protein